jgi:mono/diheme cytochrome c family protein
VREVIADGPGQMPAGLLSGNAAAAVAAYVAAATGG